MIVIDFETRSGVDLKKSGVYRYAEDESTEILCLAIDDKIKTLGDEQELKNIKGPFIAHNATFEHLIIKNKIDPTSNFEDFICTMAMCCYFSLPASLDVVAKLLNLAEQKDGSGKRLIQKLSVQRKQGTPDDFCKLFNYCVQDTATCHALYAYLCQYKYPDIERRIFLLDNRINAKGVAFDSDAIRLLCDYAGEYNRKTILRFQNLTGIEKPTQRKVLLDWFHENGESELGDMRAATLREHPFKSPLTQQVAEIRLELSKTSTAKYKRVLDILCADGRARGLLFYYGAFTGRWAGRLFQPQNLPRLKVEIPDVKDISEYLHTTCKRLIEEDSLMGFMSGALRNMITAASEDHHLLCSDFSAIETRVLFWLAGDDETLELFRQGRDIYKEMAASIYRVSYEEITAQQRQFGKTAILGLGYGMGAPKFLATCEAQGIAITLEMAQIALNTYRTKYNRVPALWRSLEYAFRSCILGNDIPKTQLCKKLTLEKAENGHFVHIHLPMGRSINYFKPFLEGRDLKYLGRNSVTRRVEALTTYGGKLVENVVQGIARDLLADKMLKLDEEGFNIVLTIHDEIICDELKDSKHTLARMESIMCDAVNWAPEIPLNVEGFASYRYKKA